MSKKQKYFLINLIILSFLIIACGTVFKKERKERPKWIKSVPQDESFLFFTGMSEGQKTEKQALDDAKIDALKNIGQFMGTRVESLVSKASTTIETEISSTYKKNIQEQVKIYSNQVIQGALVKDSYFEKYYDKGNKYRYYVLMNMSKDSIVNGISNNINSLENKASNKNEKIFLNLIKNNLKAITDENEITIAVPNTSIANKMIDSNKYSDKSSLVKVDLGNQLNKIDVFKTEFVKFAPNIFKLELLGNTFKFDGTKNEITIDITIQMQVNKLLRFFNNLTENGFTEKDDYLLVTSKTKDSREADVQTGIRTKSQTYPLFHLSIKKDDQLYPMKDLFVSKDIVVFLSKKIKNPIWEFSREHKSEKEYLRLPFANSIVIDFKEGNSLNYDFIMNRSNYINIYNWYLYYNRNYEYSCYGKGNKTYRIEAQKGILWEDFNQTNNYKTKIKIVLKNISKTLASRIIGLHVEKIKLDFN